MSKADGISAGIGISNLDGKTAFLKTRLSTFTFREGSTNEVASVVNSDYEKDIPITDVKEVLKEVDKFTEELKASLAKIFPISTSS